MPKKYLSLAEMAEAGTLPEPTHEAEYRRGYRDGFVAAIGQMHDLMLGRGLDCQEAYERCFDFWQQGLRMWQVTEVDNRLFLPPRVG